jgi:GGDEF domain-containing protein
MTDAWLADLEAQLDDELRDGAPDSPFRPTLLRWATATGRTADPDPYLTVLEHNQVGGRGGARRYRWSFPVARWIPLEDRVAWRPREAELAERQPAEHASRLWTPLVVVDHVEWLERLTHAERSLAVRASRLLDEAAPTVEDDVARHVLGADAWADTFTLWAFARRPRAIDRVRGLMTALAARYAARAARNGGRVLGRSFPFFEVPLPSATAHLASAGARIGDGIEIVGPAIDWLRGQRGADGGWADPGQPTGILTTIAVAELLGFLDPDFDPADVLPSLSAAVARRDGQAMLIGPEWPWVAAEILAFAGWSRRPFRERFRWPHVPGWMIDNRVGVPRFDAYLLNARLFETIPGLSDTAVEVAFVDLVNFGKWNNVNGMAAGDALLALLTARLRDVPESRTIRDGGDEFLVVGAPLATGLDDRLREMFAAWPACSREVWPDRPVVPLRAAVTTTRADQLRQTRDFLGKSIGAVKAQHPETPETGVIVRFETPAA